MPRTVLCHFYNEEYLLPWWLSHHVPLFDHGVMINHGSTDMSAEIVREFAPSWQLVNSRHDNFDAFLTDHEVQSYEMEQVGWKIALNVTEFLVSARPLYEIEEETSNAGKSGFGCKGFVCVDNQPDDLPKSGVPLVLQKNFGVHDNKYTLAPKDRIELGLPGIIRNRFYHNNSVGMYHPGRHASFNADFKTLRDDIFIMHYRFSPWNVLGLKRKLQISDRVSAGDRSRGWGRHHNNTHQQWQQQYDKVVKISESANSDIQLAKALERVAGTQ